MRNLALLALLTLASPAWASLDRLPVTQTSPTDFTVGYKGGASIYNYWCAAGRFVTATLRLPEGTRVYRQSPSPRQSGQGISFTLDPAKSVGDTGVSTFGGPQDGSFTASGAQQDFCNSRRPSGG